MYLKTGNQPMSSVCVLVLIGATVTFWLVSLARKWFLGSSNIDLAVAGPEALLLLVGQQRRHGRSGRHCCRWWWRLRLGRPPPHSSSARRRPTQRSASGFPSVFPKLHWFWPLYLRGPSPLALAVTLRWQKNTESWQRCSRKHKAWGFCRQSLLFLGSCFVTVKGKKNLEEFVRLFFPAVHQGLGSLFMFILKTRNTL